MIKFVAVVLLAGLAAYGFNALAQVRSDLRPPVSAIGSSSSNGISFAWFYDAAERTVVVCRIGQAAGETPDCKAKATLP